MRQEAPPRSPSSTCPAPPAPALVARRAAPRLHQVVQRRVGRAGVEGQQRARRLRPRLARVDPGQVADAAEVEERQRRLGPDPLRAARNGRTAPAARPARPARTSAVRKSQTTGSPAPRPAPRRRPPDACRARSGSCASVWPWKPTSSTPREAAPAARHAPVSTTSAASATPGSPGQRPSAARSTARSAVGIGAVAALAESRRSASPSVTTHRRVHPVERGARHRARAPQTGPSVNMAFPSSRAAAIDAAAHAENGQDADDLPPEIRLHARDDRARLSGRLHRLSGPGRGAGDGRGAGLYRLRRDGEVAARRAR